MSEINEEQLEREALEESSWRSGDFITGKAVGGSARSKSGVKSAFI